MTQFTSSLARSGRAALLALTLGAASMAAMPAPAMAQSGPSFSFRLGDGDSGMTMRFGNQDRHRRARHCLTNNEIRRGLRAHDFSNVRIVRERGRNRVDVVATHRRSGYLLRVDRCSGDVRVVERLRRGRGNDHGLHFDFRF